MMTTPRLFLGASAEGAKIADIIAAHLTNEFDVRRWNEGLFLGGGYTVDDLQEALRASRFAVIIGANDDVIARRDVIDPATQANLRFELGMILGVFGRRRVVLAIPSSVAGLAASSADFGGLTITSYAAQSGEPTTKEWLHALADVSRRIVDGLRKEIGGDRRRAEEERRLRLKDARRTAVARLHRAVTQLRDLFVELPTNALAALGDKRRFDGVKSEASVRVRKMNEEWMPDAALLEVVAPLEALVTSTCSAVEAFPYPAVYVSKDEAVAVVGRLAARAGRGGALGAAFEGAAEQVADEVARKTEEFATMYQGWWNTHAPAIRRQANALHDALVGAALVP